MTERESRFPIETPRLTLHPFTLEDAAFIVELLNDPDFLRQIGDRGVRTEEDARRYLAEGPIAMHERLGHSLWLVRLRGEGTRIGMCGLLRRDTLPEVDIGFAFLPAWRGQGYAAEAARATLAYGREVLGIGRVVAITSRDNHLSGRLLEAIGLRFETTITLPGDGEALRLYGSGRES